MADADLNPSRRALLGAAFALPLAGCASPSFARKRESSGRPDEEGKGLDPRCRGDDETRWRRTLSRFRRAESALAALEGHPDERAFGRAHDRFNAALRRLLAVPAPDVAALAAKLEIAVAAELADLTYAPPALDDLARDARRLSRA
jgi:hypothetical protein